MNTQDIKFSLSLMLALIAFPQISETIYTPALPAIAAGLAASHAAVELTLATYFIGFAFGVLLWGAFSDHWGRRATMLIGLLIYGGASLACGASTNVEALLFWRFFQAFGASVGSVITQTMLRDLYDGQQRAKLFSIIGGALAFSPAVGPVLGGFLSELFGWRANFWALFVMAIALILWALIKLPESRPQHLPKLSQQQIKHLLFRMLSSTTLWGHILLIAATNGMLFGFYEEGPFVFIELIGLRPGQYGLLGLVIASATLLAARLSYRFNQSMTSEEIIKKGSWASMLGSLLLLSSALGGAFTLSFTGISCIIVSLFTLFVGIGLIIPNSLSIALQSYQDTVGTAGSIFGSIYYLLIAAAMWGMSALHNGNHLPLPLFMLGLSALLLVGARMISAQTVVAPKHSTSL